MLLCAVLDMLQIHLWVGAILYMCMGRVGSGPDFLLALWVRLAGSDRLVCTKYHE